jgi:hypothetical protein
LKYNQPYGITDPNAGYINGDPTVGQMGSIPPAASIEQPQREIVNLINNARYGDGLPFAVPSSTDLAQMVKAVQSGLFNYGRDTGTANAYATNIYPPPISYYDGFRVIIRITNTNTGPSVLNINSLGNKNIVHRDGSTLTGGELQAGTIHCFIYDGVNFEQVWGASMAAGMPIYLTAPRNFYVNSNTGNDNYDGTVAAFTSGAHGPFRTLQRASFEVIKYNLNGYTITVYVADGSYNSVDLYMVNGSGSIIWQGNESAPANCLITGGGNTCIRAANAGSQYRIQGFKCTTTGAPQPGSLMCGIYAAGSTLAIRNMDFGACDGGHMACGYQSALYLDGTFNLSGGCAGANIFRGVHLYASTSSQIQIANGSVPPTINIPAGINFNDCFLKLDVMSMARVWYTAMNGFGNVSGKKYTVSTNSISNAGGGPNYYPGNIAGTVDTQGQYW